jgi:membrane protease YdiL (CAAX protease family)
MRALLWFLAAILGTLVVAALAAWPVWQFAHALQPEWPFHKIVSRFWQLLLLVGLVLAVRRLRLRTRADWGYGLPRSRFLRQTGAGLALGISTMLPMSIAIVALGIRALRPDLDAAHLVEGIATGLVAGLLVATVEETFFRGLMFRAVSRESGIAVAVASTALLYSAIHFLARVRIPASEVGWDSGLALLGIAFTRFADPAAIADSFITLTLVGVLLALVRARTGAIAFGIGLHMGWVCVIKTTQQVTRSVDDAPYGFLVGALDGYTGWLVAGWALLMILAAGGARWLRPAPLTPDRE